MIIRGKRFPPTAKSFPPTANSKKAYPFAAAVSKTVTAPSPPPHEEHKASSLDARAAGLQGIILGGGTDTAVAAHQFTTTLDAETTFVPPSQQPHEKSHYSAGGACNIL